MIRARNAGQSSRWLICDDHDFPAPAMSYRPVTGSDGALLVLYNKSAHPECDAMPYQRPQMIY
jgi:hypothetical protein